MYRVIIQLVANLPLTTEQMFQARPKQNFGFEVNGRFATS